MGARFSAPVQTTPGDHSAPYTMGIGSFPGVKRPGRVFDHSLLSIAEVKERVDLYLYFTPWAFVACPKMNFTFTFTLNNPSSTMMLLLVI